MAEFYNGIMIDQGALAEYIKYLKGLYRALQEENTLMTKKYNNASSGWKDEGYLYLGEKLTMLKKDVTVLTDSVFRTIRNLEELYRMVEQYLSIVRRHRR